MNKNDLKTILYMIIGVFLIVIFLKVFPFLIVAAAVIYGVFKIIEYVKEKTENVRFETNSSYAPNYSTSQVHMEDDIDTSKAIDVDYRDV